MTLTAKSPLCVRAIAPQPGNIKFLTGDGVTFLELRPDGKAFVLGEEVQSKQGVYDAFVEWLNEAMTDKPAVVFNRP